MDYIPMKTRILHHIVAIPYPGHSHINSLLNLCNFLVSKSREILVTFVVTEEWMGLLPSEITRPDNIRLTSIPNVIPSEKVRANDLDAFYEAVMTKMEAPIEKLLDRLDLPSPSVIIADTLLFWVIAVGCRRNIPVASYWPMSVSFFMDVRLRSKGDENVSVDSSSGKSDENKYPKMVEYVRKASTLVAKVQYLLISSIYEVESQKYDSLRKEFSFPIYVIGPAIPHFKLGHPPPSPSSTINSHEINYFQWLDQQSFSTVLYISFGSLFSVSAAQIDEIASGLLKSGVRFIWVVRGGETQRLKLVCGDRGLLVPWCDQLRVLCHSSVGGFLSHCGWNSVQEGIFAGVPFLTLPIAVDQTSNGKTIVEDWKVGWSIRAQYRNDDLVTCEEIAELVTKCMDLESDEGKEIRKRAKEVRDLCRRAVERSGSSDTNLDSFINDITQAKKV